MITRLGRYAGPAAYVNGGVGLLGLTLLFTFFAVGQPFGTLNDITVLVASLVLVPVMLGLYEYSHDHAQMKSLFGLSAGMLGVAGVLVLQTLLVLGVLTFWQELPYVNAAYALIGLWLILANRLARRHPITSRGLAWLGIAIGVLWIVGNISAWLGGYPTNGSGARFRFSDVDRITLVGLTLIWLAYLMQPIWSLWLGRALMSSTAGQRTQQPTTYGAQDC